jgi:uncharacterized membrane protein
MIATGSANGRNRGLLNGLGWFSIGLGLVQVVTPGAVASLIGLRDNPKTRGLLRSYGVREIAAGIGILSQARPANWVWSRVAGDVLDLSSLASALKANSPSKTRVVATTAAVAGITALDVLAAQKLRTNGGHRPEKKDSKATRSIIVDPSPDEAYNFWRNFENLPRFMTYLESVRTTGEGLSHWTAAGPGGKKIEWDTELMYDEPERLIAWRSAKNSGFENAGSVRFEAAPGGRGTIVRVEMSYAPSEGEDIGRRILHDLRNFKQVLEVGEVTESGDRR